MNIFKLPTEVEFDCGEFRGIIKREGRTGSPPSLFYPVYRLPTGRVKGWHLSFNTVVECRDFLEGYLKGRAVHLEASRAKAAETRNRRKEAAR